MSNALLMSSVTASVLSGGCFLLKPDAMVLFMLCKAVVVENFGLKPCWDVRFGMFEVSCGSSVFSSVLAIGESSDIGLYEVPWLGSLFGLGIGMILPSFQD